MNNFPFTFYFNNHCYNRSGITRNSCISFNPFQSFVSTVPTFQQRCIILCYGYRTCMARSIVVHINFQELCQNSEELINQFINIWNRLNVWRLFIFKVFAENVRVELEKKFWEQFSLIWNISPKSVSSTTFSLLFYYSTTIQFSELCDKNKLNSFVFKLSLIH